MSNEKMGGPIHPVFHEVEHGGTEDGATIYDMYFAACMTGLLANPLEDGSDADFYTRRANIATIKMLAMRKERMESDA